MIEIEEAAKSNLRDHSIKLVDLIDTVFGDSDLVDAAPNRIFSPGSSTLEWNRGVKVVLRMMCRSSYLN